MKTQPLTGKASTHRELIDLGYANDWVEKGELPPDIYMKCKTSSPPHVIGYSTVGNCKTRYVCRVCGYTYLVDSSD